MTSQSGANFVPIPIAAHYEYNKFRIALVINILSSKVL